MNNLLRGICVCGLLLLLATAACGQKKPARPAANETNETRGSVLKDVPEKIDTQARYLFYLHGRIIEEKGIRPTDERYGVYEYEEILKTLAGKGFVVISEARRQGTDIKEYAPRVVEQIRALLKAGVAPQHITVVGASKGSVITMMVSTLLRNRDVNFVIMSNCNDWVLKNFEVDLYGNVLSIYDVKDEFGTTCRKIFARATGLNRHREIELKVGTGHAILYRPLKEWVDPVVEWANQK
ncbi:MAG: alpha/beta hydrolase [Acidobacteria bacterium]|nr:alpha/beta hydrolase [Acidobacteriota bacterium]